MATVNSNPNLILTRGKNRVQVAAQLSSIDMIKRALAAGLPNETEMNLLLEGLRADAIPRSMRKQMWDDIGRRALASFGPAFSGRRHRRKQPSYRIGDDRFSGGALGRALRNDSMVLATPAGLSLINVDILDKEAQHWRRLNFGAGGGGASGDLTGPRKFPVTGLGLLIGLEPDVRPAFKIPPGFFLDAAGNRVQWSKERAGQDAFYRTRRRPKTSTRGIAASNFLDAPFRAVAPMVKPGLEQLWESYTARAGSLRTKNARKRSINAKAIASRGLGF